MRKVFRPASLFISMLVLGGSFVFTACSDDDDELPKKVTTESMWGGYTGKMTALKISPAEEGNDGEETPAGTDITAKVANDTIYFEQFPIKDIVLSIVGDETVADNIVEAVGDVNYKIGYKPTLTQNQDSVQFVMDPKPLQLAISIPASQEGEEAQALQIEVKVEAGEGAGYDVESANMKFHFGATEVLLGEGDGQQALPEFQPTTFHFDMNQTSAAK